MLINNLKHSQHKQQNNNRAVEAIGRVTYFCVISPQSSNNDDQFVLLDLWLYFSFLIMFFVCMFYYSLADTCLPTGGANEKQMAKVEQQLSFHLSAVEAAAACYSSSRSKTSEQLRRTMASFLFIFVHIFFSV